MGRTPADQWVVSVDDRISLYVYNLHNAVPIKRFLGEADDDALSDLSTFLLSKAESSRDLREEIKNHCNLPGYIGPKLYQEFLASNRPAGMPALA